MPAPTVVWLRHDLRLADNPALHAAARGPVVPLFIWAPDEEGDWPPGGAHRWWLRESLQALNGSLEEKASRLILREGPSLDTLRAVAEAVGAGAVYWNARYEPALRARDAEVAGALREEGWEVKTFAGRILHDPAAVETGSGGPYHVYGPFRRKLLDVLDVPEPLPVPRLGQSKALDAWPESTPLDALPLSPEQQDGVDWAGGMRAEWTPGEAGARARLDAFVEDALIDYDDERDRMDLRQTSMLSPHLHHGEVSPRQVWHAVNGWVQNGPMRGAADKYLAEVLWREFAYHTLFHYPRLPDEPLKEKYAAFPWRDDPEALEAWERGRTGYPIVDAGMRQLWALGWMHNRARLLTGSFLTKHLLLPWQDGERWFWDTLCGGDLGNNALNWQWVAGSGPDAQPFFRIFNPVSQAERHDPQGAYVRRWVPELESLPAKWIHHPWDAPADVLEGAGVVLGETYPRPIVDHDAARERALAAYQQIR